MENLGYLYAVGAAIAWGIVYVVDQGILLKTSPLFLLFVSSLISVLILLPIILYRGESLGIILDKSSITTFVLATLFATLANFLILSAIRLIGASPASMIEITYPFFIIFFSYLFFNTKPNIYFYLGGFLIFLGSVIIIKLG